MKKIFVLALCVLCCPALSFAQGTITLGGSAASKAGEEFATKAFQDPWDMNQRTDVGWWLSGTDEPQSNLTNVSFANGIFSSHTTNTDPSFFVVETGYGGTAAIGKIGTNFPVNADLYKLFSIRMRVTQSSQLQFFWSTNTIHDAPSLQGSNTIVTTPGWRIYTVNLATLGLIAPSFTEPWSGTKRALRLDPTLVANEDIDIDWIRLSQVEPALNRTITWTNNGSYDIYLDSARRVGNADATQTLGLLASSSSSGTFVLNLGALPPGTYYVAMRAAGSSGTLTYSTTAYTINAPALVTVTSPTAEGSSDDFATTQLGNAWDMTAMADIDRTYNVASGGITTVPAVDLNDNSLGNVSVFSGVSTPAPPSQPTVGDPIVYFMAPDIRGANYRIDPDKYRILTVEMGIPNLARSYLVGSHARVIWHVAGESPASENVSLPEVINHRAGVNNIFSFSVDMKTLPIEAGAGSPSHTGWNPGSSARPGIDGFRVDPHEFPTPTSFYFKRVKLAALETANASYTVQWATSRTGGTINLYFDDDRDPSNGKTMFDSVSASALTGSAAWNTSARTQGSEWFIYVEHVDSGGNTNGAYSMWPVRVDHNPASSTRLVVNRPTLNFGVVNRANPSVPLRGTAAQTVRVSVVGATGTPPCWTVDNNLTSTYNVTIDGGGSSKCGSGSFTVTLNPSNYFNVDGLGEARITVREVTPGSTANSPQYVRAFVRIMSSTSAPVGLVDTPAEGSAVAGSLPVTGWAVDDVDIASVKVYRDPAGGESGLVFIGDAVRVDDARPDIEFGNPTTPFNYRGGWGYLMLTNFLPNGGDGTFRLHVIATDLEGNQTLLGSRTIIGTNGINQAPFGAIDKPEQGEVVSGALTAYHNFGWVLARGPAIASPGLSAAANVFVVIDGLAVGTPAGWTSRSDLSGLFPESTYPGITKAFAVYTFNPSVLTNGVHTIAWGVIANNGQSAGVGSRYFTIAGSPLNSAVISADRLDVGPDLGRRAMTIGTIATVGPQTIVSHELSRVVVDPFRGARGKYDAYLVADGELRALPIGASFDESRGILYWQPGVGYTGAYDFVVVRDRRERVPVRVVLKPHVGVPLAFRSRLSGVRFPVSAGS
jgi:hypothetical protein